MIGGSFRIHQSFPYSPTTKEPKSVKPKPVMFKRLTQRTKMLYWASFNELYPPYRWKNCIILFHNVASFEAVMLVMQVFLAIAMQIFMQIRQLMNNFTRPECQGRFPMQTSMHSCKANVFKCCWSHDATAQRALFVCDAVSRHYQYIHSHQYQQLASRAKIDD